MDFTTFNERLKKVISNFDSIVLESAMEVESSIVDLQVKQLEEGKTYKDQPIKPAYQSDVYATTKKAIGAKPPKGTPDLKLTGDFHSGVYANYYKGAKVIETFSKDEKAPRLTEKYKDIWGLTKKNQAELNKEIEPVLQKRLKNELLTS